jgi:hypothetical protein
VPSLACIYHKQLTKNGAICSSAPRSSFAPGVNVDLLASDFMHAAIAFTGEYEHVLSHRVVALGRKGGAFVDVGAKIGNSALLWAASNPCNTASTFEASPRN